MATRSSRRRAPCSHSTPRRKNMPYDPRKDITPLAMTARAPFVLVVNPALPVRSVDDLVKLAREKPRQLTFAAPGAATFHRLQAELFKTVFGLDFIYVPYKGSVPALTDVAGGHAVSSRATTTGLGK